MHQTLTFHVGEATTEAAAAAAAGEVATTTKTTTEQVQICQTHKDTPASLVSPKNAQINDQQT